MLGASQWTAQWNDKSLIPESCMAPRPSFAENLDARKSLSISGAPWKYQEPKSHRNLLVVFTPRRPTETSHPVQVGRATAGRKVQRKSVALRALVNRHYVNPAIPVQICASAARCTSAPHCPRSRDTLTGESDA
jgi:hypothetical protein